MKMILKAYKKVCGRCLRVFYCLGNCKNPRAIPFNLCFCPDCVEELDGKHSWLFSPENCPRMRKFETNPSYRNKIIESKGFKIQTDEHGKVLCPQSKKKQSIKKCSNCSHRIPLQGEFLCELRHKWKNKIK